MAQYNNIKPNLSCNFHSKFHFENDYDQYDYSQLNRFLNLLFHELRHGKTIITCPYLQYSIKKCSKFTRRVQTNVDEPLEECRRMQTSHQTSVDKCRQVKTSHQTSVEKCRRLQMIKIFFFTSRKSSPILLLLRLCNSRPHRYENFQCYSFICDYSSSQCFHYSHQQNSFAYF